MASLCISTVAPTGTNAPVRELGAVEPSRRPPAAGNPSFDLDQQQLTILDHKQIKLTHL